MRISTALLYQTGSDSIGRSQSDLLRTQQQIAAGKRMLTAADDPVAAAQALVTRQSQGETDRYVANVSAAKDALGLNDSVLGQITEVLQNVRTSALEAGNGALTDADRSSVAADLKSHLDALLSLANSRDGNGNYLFSGFQTTTQPFAQTGATVAYSGDQGQRVLEVSPGRTMEISQTGSALFLGARTGNGTFVQSAAATNTGTGVVGGGTVSNPAALDGHTYTLQFNVAGSVTTYDVQDVTAGTTVSTGNSYTAGSAIGVAGMQVTITGAPATGDSFTLAPAAPQSLFTTLANLASTLLVSGTTAAGRASITNGLNTGLQNIDQALEHVLSARSDTGAKLRELDTLTTGNDGRALQYQQTLSRLEDLDYNKALSHFAQQQVALEAAQKSFLKLTGLSLFEYL